MFENSCQWVIKEQSACRKKIRTSSFVKNQISQNWEHHVSSFLNTRKEILFTPIQETTCLIIRPSGWVRKWPDNHWLILPENLINMLYYVDFFIALHWYLILFYNILIGVEYLFLSSCLMIFSIPVHYNNWL